MLSGEAANTNFIPNQGSNPRFTALEESMLTITPLMWLWGRGGLYSIGVIVIYKLTNRILPVMKYLVSLFCFVHKSWFSHKCPLVPITIKVVSSNPAHGEMYLIQLYVVKFASDLRQVIGFLQELRFPPSINLTITI